MTSALQALQDLQQRFARVSEAPPAEMDQCIYWAGTALGMACIPLLVGEGELDEIIERQFVGSDGSKASSVGGVKSAA